MRLYIVVDYDIVVGTCLCLHLRGWAYSHGGGNMVLAIYM